MTNAVKTKVLHYGNHSNQSTTDPLPVIPSLTGTSSPGATEKTIISSFPETFDLTNTVHHHVVKNFANILLEKYPKGVLTPKSKNIFYRLAVKMAQARQELLYHSERKMRILVCMNLLGEHNRLQPKNNSNPNGENSLLNKVEEIVWLTKGTETTIDILYVSGKDWWQSEKILHERIAVVKERYFQVQVQLVKTRNVAAWEGINTNDKGGEWNLGVNLMVGEGEFAGILPKSYDAIYLTDADTTFNLASSLGSAIVDYISHGWKIILGDRKNPKSMFQKNFYRLGPGAGWRYLISRYLGRIFYEMGIGDTQCPSRFYSLDAAQVVSKKANMHGWAVETDHNQALMAAGYKLHFVPTISVDSEKESVGARLPYGNPDKAYRMADIFMGQIEQLEKYKNLKLPHLNDSLRMAKIVEERIFGYNPEKPWEGLSKLLQHDDPKYRLMGNSDFSPDNISLNEFEKKLDIVFTS